MKNETLYLTAPQSLEIRESEMPAVGDSDVLVEVRHVGICGSDVNFYRDATSDGLRDVSYPIVLGHECAGEVVQVGNNVTHLKVGDRVALEPGVPCGHCEVCRSGRYNLCPSLTFLAAPPFHSGALSRYVSHPADFAWLLPDSMDTVDGAMIEPMAIGFYAAKRVNVSFEEIVVILGGGCIGLMCVMACKARGAGTVIVADLFDNRLIMASELGADIVINSSKKDLTEAVLAATGNRGADVVFESAGNSMTVAATTKTVRRGGRIAMVGMSHQPIPFDFYAAAYKECDILSIFRYANMYPLARKAIEHGGLNPRAVVTDTFRFEDAASAFERALTAKEEAIKVMIEY